MNEEEKLIISKLLKKFSESKPFITGEERKRAVILKFDSSNFPQYNYEDYDVKERFYKAVANLVHDFFNRNFIFSILPILSKTISAPITQRVFSIKCYHNSKHFERVVQQDIVQIIKNNEPSLKEMLETEVEISDRLVLAQVGIILRAEMFEFCGDITLETTQGICDFSSLKNGACIRSETVEEVKNIYFGKAIDKIIFIENKTNYDEYILTHKSNNHLVIYHGGFYSPQKAAFFQIIKKFMPKNINCLFWADIDYGGFKMFVRLKRIFDNLQPMYMDKCTYGKYSQYGLEHSTKYFENLSKLLHDKNYEIFYDVIREILLEKKTVEQEVLLENIDK